jgi:ribosomal protein L22
MAICDFIRGKEIEKMITELAKVVSMKMPIKMRGEIPHRRNIGPGRYPINASKAFINLLKSLKANIEVNQIDNPYIAVAVANDASRPFKKGGMRFKRTNVLLIAREKAKKEAKAEKKEENKKVKEKK